MCVAPVNVQNNFFFIYKTFKKTIDTNRIYIMDNGMDSIYQQIFMLELQPEPTNYTISIEKPYPIPRQKLPEVVCFHSGCEPARVLEQPLGGHAGHLVQPLAAAPQVIQLKITYTTKHDV